MSIEAVKWAGEVKGLTSPQAFVLRILADHYNDAEGHAWPSVKRLAAKTSLSRRTVHRALNELEKRKLVRRRRTRRDADGGWSSNMYTLPQFEESEIDDFGPTVRIDEYFDIEGASIREVLGDD